jgi:hypothetical protein
MNAPIIKPPQDHNALFQHKTQCPNNIKKKYFGLVKYQGEHNFEVVTVHKWAFHKYEALGRCTHCGAEEYRIGITSGELLAAGVAVPPWNKRG